jgi:putative FmdB family regulatory protein
MPVYTYECNGCKKIFDTYRHVDERHIACPYCGNKTEIIIDGPIVVLFDIDPYFDKGMNCYVKSKKDRLRKMAEKGLHEAPESMDRQMRDVKEEDAERNHRRKV